MKQKADLVVLNSRQVVTVAGNGSPKAGAKMSELGIVPDGAVAVYEQKIVWVGSTKNWKDAVNLANDAQILDAEGGAILPGLVDCHTHLIFAGTREDEFSMKIAGIPYMEIARKGGGIKRTVTHTRNATEDQLFEIAQQRLRQAVRFGITCIEIKSGYGLEMETELKMLRVAQKLRNTCPVEIVSTFLGAHEVPQNMDKETYLHEVCSSMIPQVASENLAEFCDVFCEAGVFTVEEAERVLQTGCRYGLKPKIHADQITAFKGAQLAGALRATSADHLDYTDPEGISAIRDSDTVAVLLPGSVFFLGQKKYPPARQMISDGLVIALATDFNPGSCMTQNIHLITTIACAQCKMTIPEAITAITLNAAYAIGRGDRCGSIETGKRADLIILDTPSFEMIPYHFGHNHVRHVLCNGHLMVCDFKDRF